MQSAFKEALEQFQQVNGLYPQQIIVFRDGVSDQQRKTVLQTEVAQIQQAFAICPQKPKLLFVIINKRVSAKFYTTNMQNPSIGCVVDRGCVNDEETDFYMMPCKATQGSQTPTHYHVIYDDIKKPIDDLMALAYRLCFTYYNWSGSIRVPSPVKLAHKMAYFLGEMGVDKGQAINVHQQYRSLKSSYYI